MKILDMGLARVGRAAADSGESSSALTREGAVMGTPDYIAPEQATDSHTVDIRADLYSLGCTFYYLLSGRPPFAGGEALAKLMKHKTEEAKPIEQLRPEVLPLLAGIVRTLMAKNPDDRFQTPAELVEALDQVQGLVSDAFSVGNPENASEPPPANETIDEAAASALPLAVAPPAAPQVTAWSEIVKSGSATEMLVKAPSHAEADRAMPWRWIGVGATAIVLLLIALFWQPWRPTGLKKGDGDPIVAGPKRALPAVADAEREAMNVLKPLVARMDDPTEKPETLRDEFRAFLRQHSGTEAATKACAHLGKLLAGMPSPLDKLSHKNLPADCIESWKTWQRAAGDKYAAGPPSELVAAIGEHRQRHWDAVMSLSLSPDAKLLASIGVRDNAICLWDAETMELLQYLYFGWNGASIAFAPDGKSLAAMHNDAISVFDVVDRRLIEAARGEVPFGLHFAWSPDGTRLATVGYDQIVRLWDYGDKKLKLAWKSPKQDGYSDAVVFASQGTRLVTGHGEVVPAGEEPVGSLHVWDLSTSRPALLKSLKVKRGLTRGLALSADGQYLAWGGQHLQVWRLMDKELQDITKENAGLQKLMSNHAICWQGKAPVLLVRYGHQLAVVDFADGTARVRPELSVPPLYSPCLASSVDGKVLAGGLDADGGVRVWDVVETQDKVPDPEDAQRFRVVRYPSRLTERRPPDARFTGVAALCFTPEGDLAVGGPDGAVHLWDLSGRTKEAWFRTGEAAGAAPRYLGTGGVPPNPSRVFGVAFLPGGKRFAVTVGHHVEIWDRGADKARAFRDPPTMGMSLALSADGATLVSGCHEGALRFYNVAEPDREHRLPDEVPGEFTPAWAAFSPDGARLAVACQNKNVVQLWRMPPQPAQVPDKLETQSPVWTAFTPDGRKLLVAGQDNHVRFWDPTRTPPASLDERPVSLQQAQFFKSLDISPDGRWLAALRCAGGDPYSYYVVVWDLVEQRAEQEWPWPGNILHLRFAPDGRHIAVGNSNGTVYLLRFIPDKLRPWREKVAEVPVEDQITAVLRKLKEHNPDFDEEKDQKKRYDPEGKPYHHYVDQGKLLHFNLFSDHLTDLTPVRAFPHLTGLECEGRSFDKDKRGTGKLTDLSALRGLRLTALNCSTNPEISDLAPLAKMPLQVLAFPYTAVSDLSPLRGMPLVTLNCKGCPISDLEPLRGMSLGWLDIGKTNVADLTPLTGMLINKLYLDECPVSDLTSLKTLTKLELLWIDKTKAADLSHLQDLPLVEIRLDDPKRHAEVLRKITTLKTINGQDAAKTLGTPSP